MYHIVGIEPQFKNIIKNGPLVPMIVGNRKPKGQLTGDERKAANLDQRLKSLIMDFQDSPPDEENTRSSQEYMNDLEMKFHERSRLANSKRFFKKAKYNKVNAKLALFSSGASSSKSSRVKNQGLIAEAYEWDEEEVSSDDNEMVEVKVLMALADDEREAVDKESVRNGTDSSATNYDSADESSVCSTNLPLLEKLSGVEPLSGPNTIKLILKSNLTFKDETLKGVTINEPTPAPAKEKNVSASISNLAPAEEVKNFKLRKLKHPNPKGLNHQMLIDLRLPLGGGFPSKTNHLNLFVQSDIRKPIWYLDTGCSSLISINKLFDAKYIVQFDAKRETIFNSNKEVVMIAPRGLNTRRQQTEETYHITFYESTNAIKFTFPSVDNITIADSERYQPDEPEHVVIEVDASSDHNGQVDQNDHDQNDHPVQSDETLNDDQSEHSNHTNDEKIIDNLTNTKDAQNIEPLSFQTKDTLAQTFSLKKNLKRYVKGTPSLGLWYLKFLGFDLKGYSDFDYVGCNMDKKSTSGACQLLGCKILCWGAKKQHYVAMSSAKAEYVAAGGRRIPKEHSLDLKLDIGAKQTYSTTKHNPGSKIEELKSASRHNALADSIAEADLEKSAPNDFLSTQQDINKGTKNYSFNHFIAGCRFHYPTQADSRNRLESGYRASVRKFLRALLTKWRPKVTAIEESKDLSTLPLDELIGNLKVYEVVLEKDLKASKIKKEKYKSLDLKARKVSSDEEESCSDSDEEYAMAEKKKGKKERRCFKCGDLNHFISDCPKHSINDQNAFVGGCWSDSEEEDDSKKDEIYLMAVGNNEVLSDTLYYSSSASDSESLQINTTSYAKLVLG
uniref:Uncharacterized mitochondrial protein AtMg00810-like n=1 Tax=Tanacetum cinerariifolium TaxID=118510 RepID=A0A6L2MU40_TANCI|nr:uncharacterized mitochondrial protein AtMg00810-like [Tanacetum cinerariifolium]